MAVLTAVGPYGGVVLSNAQTGNADFDYGDVLRSILAQPAEVDAAGAGAEAEAGAGDAR